MKRAAAWCVGLFLTAISLCACGNGLLFPLEVPFHLAFGWIRYPFAVLPRVTVDVAGVGLFAAAVPLAAWLAHGMGRWLYEGDAAAGRRWRWRWTWLGFAGVLLMFAAGVAATGVVHQAGWLIRSPAPLTESSWKRGKSYRTMCASNLKQIGQALKLYANENGGYRPIDRADLARIAGLEDLIPDVFICPADDRWKAPGTQPSEWVPQLNDEHCSYLYCPAPVLGPDGIRGVVMYEELDHHRAGINVLYEDGEAAWVDGPAAERWLDALASQRPTTRDSLGQ